MNCVLRIIRGSEIGSRQNNGVVYYGGCFAMIGVDLPAKIDDKLKIPTGVPSNVVLSGFNRKAEEMKATRTSLSLLEQGKSKVFLFSREADKYSFKCSTLLFYIGSISRALQLFLFTSSHLIYFHLRFIGNILGREKSRLGNLSRWTAVRKIPRYASPVVCRGCIFPLCPIQILVHDIGYGYLK